MHKSIILFFCLFLSFPKAMIGREVEKISIQFAEQSMLSALHELEKVSEFRFVFQDKMSDEAIVTNIGFELVNTFQILDALLADTGYGFVISRYGRDSFWVIIYKKKSITKTDPVLISITGRVYMSYCHSAPGATLFLIPDRSTTSPDEIFIDTNENFLAVTSMDGNFFIPSVDKNAQVLVTFLGYLPRVVIAKDIEQIKLERDTKYDDIIITTGY